MPPIIAITVLWCLNSAPFDQFNPHQLGAAQAFVRAYPDVCGVDPPLILERDVTLEQCQSQGFLHLLPGYHENRPGRVYMGAPCVVHQPEPLEIYSLKAEN
jgi:hypothetical protein